MTVSYSRDVFTSTGTYGLFLKLLFRWRGSIYKLIWYDLLVYVILYYILSCLYRFALNDEQKLTFEHIALYCSSFADLIPVTFVLGFYVSLVIQRWWSQFESLPWPDSASVWISTCIHGQHERGRLMRRTIVRYLNLTLILTLRLISLPVKKRFPTLDHLVEAGILLEGEKKIFEKMDELAMNHPKYWMPLVWAGSIVTRARKEGMVKDDFALKALIDKLDQYRRFNGTLLNYDWVTIPLVYTQVVTLAVYSFLLSTLMGRQFLDVSKNYKGHEVDLFVPIFTFLQFFFYMGWLKVAEALINPFGEDDDDFDVNWLIDRNLQVSYLIVDEMHLEHPQLIRDQFWDEVFPELPYTAAAEETRVDQVMGGAANVEIDEEAAFLPMGGNLLDGDEDAVVAGTSVRFQGQEQSSGVLEGIVIDVPEKNGHHSDGKDLSNGRALPKVASTVTMGSNSTLGGAGLKAAASAAAAATSSSSSTRQSTKMPSVVSAFNRMMTMGGDVKIMGSNASIFSKKSRAGMAAANAAAAAAVGGAGGGGAVPPRRRKMGRSISRISNGSESQSPLHVKLEPGFLHGYHSRGLRSSQGQDDDDMICSMSSLNSQADLLDFTSMHKLSLQEPPSTSALAASGAAAAASVGHLNRPQRSSLEVRRSAAAVQLRQRLETLHSLHQEVLQLHLEHALEAEADQDAAAEEEEEEELLVLRSLEERTEMLKRQLRQRRHKRHRTISSPIVALDVTTTSTPAAEVTAAAAVVAGRETEESHATAAGGGSGTHELEEDAVLAGALVPRRGADEEARGGGDKTNDDPSADPTPSPENTFDTELSTIEEEHSELGYLKPACLEDETEGLLPKLSRGSTLPPLPE